MAKTTLPAGDDLKSDADADEVDPSDAELERGDRQAETWEVADAADDDADDDTDEDEKALDELEAEELEMLTEDEAAEKLVVNEAAEMAAIRRAELALANSGDDRAEDEFLCQNCFLLKKPSQLADKRRQLCTDCA